jgi:hypothetical protein
VTGAAHRIAELEDAPVQRRAFDAAVAGFLDAR